MNLICTLYVALLFVLLTPGVLLRLPPKGSLLTVAIVHGLVFALVYHFTHKMVLRLSMEGFEEHMPMPKPKPSANGSGAMPPM
jgi:hypothetical protein